MKFKNYCLFLFLLALSLEIFSKEYNVIDYGAISDTNIISTRAIQKAIDECFGNGGGKVLFPAGIYATGTIVLKSNVSLYLDAGAVLYGSRDIDDYIPLKPLFVSLRTQEATIQLIYAENARNVSITGFGTIDGRGSNFKKLSWNDEGITRPHLLRFITCESIIIGNITLRNSGCWMQHYLACENLQVRGIKIYNHNNYNNDGIDIDGCKNVTISDLISDSDDDGITLKSTSERSCENVAITNCVISSHCNAIKLGTESNGGFKNIVISNCVVKPSAVSATKFFGELEGTSGLSLEIVDGGLMQGITVSNITIDGTLSPLFIRLANRARPFKKEMVINHIGSLRDVLLSNINIKNAGNVGCSVTGMPGHPLSNIRFRNIAIEYAGGVVKDSVYKVIPEKEKDYPDAGMFGILPAYGFYIRHASTISFDGIELTIKKPDERPAFYLDDVQDADFTGMKLTATGNNIADIWLHQSADILIKDNRLKGKSNCFVKLDETNKQISILNNHIPGAVKIVNTGNMLKNQVTESGNR